MANNLIKAEISLTRTQWDQLSIYIKWARESGTYYGNKKQFENRDKAILDELNTKVFEEHLCGFVF